jgi:hypothetical protein
VLTGVQTPIGGRFCAGHDYSSRGPVAASATVATIQDRSAFASGREFGTFLGL